MCDKCKNKKCGGGCSPSNGKDLAKLANLVAELQNTVDAIDSRTKFLGCGHPIFALTNADDIECFDMETGYGSKCFEGFGVCNGNTYVNANGENVATYNLMSKFLVGAGDDYEVGDSGGLDEVTLVIAEMPAHSHTVTDLGHTHDIADPGHTHAIVQDPHDHTFSGGSHTHDFAGDTNETGSHEHAAGSGISIEDVGTGVVVREENASGASTSSNGLHAHSFSGTTSGASTTGTVGSASISISNSDAFVGITETEESATGITTVSQGGDEAHENRPPYVAVLFVIKL